MNSQPKPPPAYAELHCVSNFSFLRGASHPEELVQRANALGYSALAITDECSVAGVVRAHVAARDSAMKLIIGSEVRLDDGMHLVVLAATAAGYSRLCRLITQGRRSAEKGHYHLTHEDIADGLPGCRVLLVPGRDISTDDAAWIAARFSDRAFIAVELHRGGEDRARLSALQFLSRQSGLRMVAAGDVHMHDRGRRALQDSVTCIRHGCTLENAGYRLFPNAEHHLRSRETLATIYPNDLMEAAAQLAAECHFTLDELQYRYPAELVPDGQTASQHLDRLTRAGIVRRWPGGPTAEVRLQIDRELKLIAELGYEHYFLTVHDIVDFARERGILCQGRGSAANSAVCFALGITEVDPARSSLLFERFISRERNEPPDIDVDFEHDRREEVIQYLYSKYGRHRAALAATVITYRARSAVRDLGKVLGLGLDAVERLSASLAWWDQPETLPARLRELGFDPDAPVIRRLMKLTGELLGFPRHLSQHVGGFVISENPLWDLVPVENAAMVDRSIIQWDKDDLDALGLLKVDCLALGMLSAIRRSFDLLEGFRGRRWKMSELPVDDPQTFAMIRRADTVGVFQIESRAQMTMLPRLAPREFYDLVIEVAIVRPGPIQGGMVHPFLQRRQGLEAVDYPSEALKQVLERTLGVPIFQEQVMQIAVVAAGFTPGEADRLRRSMAAWRRNGRLDGFRERLIHGMQERGYSEQFAEQIFQQILGFGEYGFPESHAASFALLVYVSAWLKCHEPAAFCAGLLNSQPMGFYAPSQLVQDARRHGVEFRPLDVCHSDWDCTLERRDDGEPEIRLGLRMVRGLGEAVAQRIVGQRHERMFTNIDDLAHRAALDPHARRCLSRAGAFRSLAGHRHEAAWVAEGVEQLPGLLDGYSAVEAKTDLRVPSEGEDIVADFAGTGLTLGRHPLSLLRDRLRRLRSITAEQWNELPNDGSARVAGLVTHRQRPSTASGVVFITLEDETGIINLVVWPKLVEKFRAEVLGAQLMLAQGVMQREGDVRHCVVRHVEDRSTLLGKLDTRSRDFH